METSKVFALDTNVLVQDPYAIEKFGEADVLLAQCVIEELDKLKNNPTVEMAARLASCQIAAYCDIGSLKDGVKKSSSGMIFVDSEKVNFRDHPFALEETNDNRIVLTALRWRQKSGKTVIIKSNDVNVRITANALGLASEAYEYDKKVPLSRGLYTGTTIIDLLHESHPDIFQFLAQKNRIDATVIAEAAGSALELYPNQCCYIRRPGGETMLALYKKGAEKFQHVPKPKTKSKSKSESMEIFPLNAEQAFAYALLTDPAISFVTLRGKAGSGKTLMALLAGHEQTEERYDKLLVYRPNIELGRSLGFLPGTLNEKFQPWMQPIVDNFHLIIRRSPKDAKAAENRPRGGRKNLEPPDPKEDLQADVYDFIPNLLEISPINFMRGRSLHRCFIIIDEAQNLDPHEIKTMLTRVGAESKVVLTGDTDQIDNRYLTSMSNGLSYAIEKFKGQEVFGHVTLQKTERSHLAELAANLL